MTQAADGDRTDREEEQQADAAEAAAPRATAGRTTRARTATSGAAGTAKRAGGTAKAGAGVARPKATSGEPGAKRSGTRSNTGARKAGTRVAAAEQASGTVRDRNGKAPADAPAAAPAPDLGPAVPDLVDAVPPQETTEVLPVADAEPTKLLPVAEPVAAPPPAAAPPTTPLSAAVPASPPAAAVPVSPPAAAAPVSPPAAAVPVSPPAAAVPAVAPPAAVPSPAVAEPPADLPAVPPAPSASTSRFRYRPVLRIDRLAKRFGPTIAVDGIDLVVQPGSFYGIVGPNGAGKTTTLSMITGLLRPDAGSVHVHGIDVWREPERAKRAIGVLPDTLRLFDRLSGAQLLHYSGVLRGLDAGTVKQRSADLVQAFGLEDATGRLVADYSAGMTKKIALACAMIHSPRLLVLDEPFESVDPVSAANIVEILQRYVRAGGTVVLSSHGMDLIQRVCDHVAIVIGGRVLASGTVDEVRGEQSLEDRFVDLAGGRKAAEGLEWLHSFSD